nr:putative ribonuclease H-like domain-containing protein [Tanacetum cinerariifolium]
MMVLHKIGNQLLEGCQFLGKRLISWQCKKQTIVATSTTEAEYVATASGCRQVLWIQNQMLDYGGMTLEEIKEKFILVWKQLEDFVPMSSKEEGERVKRKGLKLDQGSAKRMKTSKDVSEEDLKGMMQLVPLKEVYVEALQDKEIFMLVEKDYPLRKGLATVMICNKLQVEQYYQMANDLILKIHNITNSPR